MEKPLHKIWWLWTPLFIGLVQVLIEIFMPENILAELHTEQGPHEFIEFLFIGAAFFIALSILFRLDLPRQKYLAGWVGLAAVCCFYVAGEEISWGQHLLKWSTPEYWTHINDQGETNLHNTTSWLDQKPRLILLIGTVTGGLLIPALQRFKPALVPQKFTIIYPPAILGVTAGLALTTNLADKLAELVTGTSILTRGSEVEELYLFYFVLLYLIILRRRVLS